VQLSSALPLCKLLSSSGYILRSTDKGLVWERTAPGSLCHLPAREKSLASHASPGLKIPHWIHSIIHPKMDKGGLKTGSWWGTMVITKPDRETLQQSTSLDPVIHALARLAIMTYRTWFRTLTFHRDPTGQEGLEFLSMALPGIG
jgi:hypothetical protein